jgi:hypothetical protein
MKEIKPHYVEASISKTPLDDAVKQMGIGDFYEKVVSVFSDQVTCVCTKTGRPLFDLEKATLIRGQVAQVFDAILQVMDEEIKEYS